MTGKSPVVAENASPVKIWGSRTVIRRELTSTLPRIRLPDRIDGPHLRVGFSVHMNSKIPISPGSENPTSQPVRVWSQLGARRQHANRLEVRSAMALAAWFHRDWRIHG